MDPNLNLNDTKPALVCGVNPRNNLRRVSIDFNFKCCRASSPPFTRICVLVDEANSFVRFCKLSMSVMLNLAAETLDILFIFLMKFFEESFSFLPRANSFDLHKLSIHPGGECG